MEMDFDRSRKEKSILDLSEPGHVTTEIAHLRKIEKHTAKLAVIQGVWIG